MASLILKFTCKNGMAIIKVMIWLCLVALVFMAAKAVIAMPEPFVM